MVEGAFGEQGNRPPEGHSLVPGGGLARAGKAGLEPILAPLGSEQPPTPAPLPLPLGATSVPDAVVHPSHHDFVSAPFSSSFLGSFLFPELISFQNKPYTYRLHVCVSWCSTYSVCVHCNPLLGGVSSLRAWHIVGAQDHVTGVCLSMSQLSGSPTILSLELAGEKRFEGGPTSLRPCDLPSPS